MRFHFSTVCIEDAFFKPVMKGVQDAAGLLGVETVFEGTHEVDIEGHLRLIEKAIAGGCDGLAIAIAHPDRYNGVIRLAREKGLPVVAFTLDNAASGRMSGVAQDTFRAGQAFAGRMEKLIPDGGKVLVSVHTEGIDALEKRIEGMRSGLAHKGIRWKKITASTTAEESACIIGKALDEDPEICAVCATGLPDTEGAGMALHRRNGAMKIAAAGFDLSETILRHIEQGILAFTIDQQPYIQGFMPAMQLYLCCKLGLAPSDMDSGAAVID